MSEAMLEQKAIGRQFTRYVSQNILGMLGISFYILADTFFIAKAEGAVGVAALNLVLPLYSVIFAIGAMIGVGSATCFRIARARGERTAEYYFSNAFIWTTLIGIMFMLPGGMIPEKIVSILGGDEEILAVGTSYTRIFMMFAPCFMWNYVCNAFVRNDGAPSLAMAATLCSSLFNVLMDYVLMFPLGLGMRGAALATAVSPVIGVCICSFHFFSKKNTICFKVAIPSVKRLFQSCQLGVSAFVGEISSGVTTAVFNMLILRLAGNIGVAAYGVVANTALVAVSVFNGVAQGAQPLFSEFYGKGAHQSCRKVLKMGKRTALFIAVAMIVLVSINAERITALFNSENNPELTAYAVQGIKLYFTGFLFAGINIIGTGYLSATEQPGWAFAASITRGFVAIIACAVILSIIWGMNGIWLAFPAAELVTLLITSIALKRTEVVEKTNTI